MFGREAEIDRTLDVLAKRHATVPASSAPRASARRASCAASRSASRTGARSPTLDDRVIVEIEAAALLAGTGVRGALAERIAQIKAEVARSEGRVVLFFDELHAVLTGDEEVAAELKVALARGELACIGATTVEDYKRVVLGDPRRSRGA